MTVVSPANETVGTPPALALVGKKIVHLAFSEAGGAGIAACRLHRGMVELGFDSKLLSFLKVSTDATTRLIPTDASGRVFAGIGTQGVSPALHLTSQHWQRLYSHHPNRPQGLEMYSDTQSFARIDCLQELREADIVNLHWVSGLLDFSRVRAALQGKTVIWTLHDMNPFTGGCHYAGTCRKYLKSCHSCPQLGYDGQRDLGQKCWEEKYLGLKDLDIHVVTPSRWLAECASASTILGRFPVHAIANGLAVDIFRPYPAAPVRELLKIPPHHHVVLFGADSVVNQRKGFAYLIEAIKRIPLEKQRNITLACFGQAPAQLLDSLAFNFVNLGAIHNENNLAMIYSMADVFVVPSLEDNLPNTVLEALACGTPVAGFAIGGIPDMVEHRTTGYLAPARDVDSLKDGILWCLEAAGSEISERCRQRAIARYALQNQAAAYLELYARAVQGKDKPASRPWAENAPKISVAVISSGGASLLLDSLTSLKGQTIAEQLEIIIADPTGDPQSAELAADFQRRHPDSIYLRPPASIEESGIWNLALRLAGGEYVTILRSGDLLAAGALEILLDALKDTPDALLVYGNAFLSETPQHAFVDQNDCQPLHYPEFCHSHLPLYRDVISPFALWRRRVHDALGYFAETDPPSPELFWYKAGTGLTALHLPEFVGMRFLRPDLHPDGSTGASRETL